MDHPKEWCDNQLWSREDQSFTCLAHLAEARAFACPYKDNEERMRAEYPCSDYSTKGLKDETPSTVIMDGKFVAQQIIADIKSKCGLFTPNLAVIIVGNDPASEVYVRNKTKDCMECGFQSETYHFPENAPERKVIETIRQLNQNADVSGILVQLPLPATMNTVKILNSIDPTKDVDCFHTENVGRFYAGRPRFEPCTPAGVMRLLDWYDIEIEGKMCVVLGRSNIVGRPLAHMLQKANGTVTVCHSKTVGIPSITQSADILVSAVGTPNFVTADMVKEGAVVIDVGINRVDGKLCGDVDFDKVSKIASYITPVPGGVGPMTRAMLMENILKADTAQIHASKESD